MTTWYLGGQICLFFVVTFLVNVNNTRRYDKKAFSYQFVKRDFSGEDFFASRPFDELHLNDNLPPQPGSNWFCFFLGMCTPWYPGSNGLEKTHIAYEWSQLEYNYPSPADRQAAIDNGEFNVGYPVPIDVDVHFGDNNRKKIFVTMPRFQGGVPATLGTITDGKLNGNSIIDPYPSWSWHQNLGACNPERIVSVFRVKIDECGRLWVLDAGRMVDRRICPAQLLVFDVDTDQLLHRYEIPESQLASVSILVTPIVDVRDRTAKCRDTFVYLADCQGMALIVYDFRRDTSWRVIDKTMYPYPNYGTYHIAGQQFDLMDGILGMDLSPYRPGEDRVLFYHAMSSGTENWAYTSHLRNETLFETDPSAVPGLFHTYSGRRRSQAPAMAIDKNGIAFFGLASETSMNCWNTAGEYGDRNIGTVAQNQETMQFPSGVKVITNRHGKQELWFLTMRFQRIATGTLNPSEGNFRIHVAKVDELVRGSKCAQGGHHHRPSNGHHSGLQNVGSGGNQQSGRYGGSQAGGSNKGQGDEAVQFPSDK